MKQLGQPSIFTNNGLVLIRSKDLPRMYSAIVNKDNKIVGKINDIIGPKMDPHIVMKPTKEVAKNPGEIEGEVLYSFEKKIKRNKKWKKRN